MEICSVCGVTKMGLLFKPSVGKPMLDKEFYKRCCQYAKTAGCINSVKINGTLPKFDGATLAKSKSTSEMNAEVLISLYEQGTRDFRGVNLSGSNLRYADLSDARLIGADLRGANLRYADLRYSDFSHADLGYANLSNANLSAADLKDADLRGADLRYADLSGAKLAGANLKDCDLG